MCLLMLHVKSSLLCEVNIAVIHQQCIHVHRNCREHLDLLQVKTKQLVQKKLKTINNKKIILVPSA